MTLLPRTQFGFWTVIPLEEYRLPRPCAGTAYMVKCRCSCGVEKLVEKASLVHGRSRSCGHRKKLFGKDNPGWKGGTHLHKTGYVVINGRKVNGKVVGRSLQHISVMEKRLGRKLSPDETVHHKNGIRRDNRDSNLELWASNHPPGQRVSDLVKWARKLLRKYKPALLK